MITVTNLCGRTTIVRFPATAEPDALRVGAFRCTQCRLRSPPADRRVPPLRPRYTNPRWPDGADAYVAVEDETYVKERHGRELTFATICGSRTYRRPGRAPLDGALYAFAEVAAAGWRASGGRAVGRAAAEAQRRGLPSTPARWSRSILSGAVRCRHAMGRHRTPVGPGGELAQPAGYCGLAAGWWPTRWTSARPSPGSWARAGRG
jgi:hypothetical protein